MYLEKINSPADVKKLTVDEMTVLAEEMRKALLFRLSKHGGHFGPNFGMVEATIAMHYVFESPKDKIVFDVSHQSYPHKMLTGRKESYLDADKFDDISGYTNPEESEHDIFTVGHTSTSVSLASGLDPLLFMEKRAAFQNSLLLLRRKEERKKQQRKQKERQRKKQEKKKWKKR